MTAHHDRVRDDPVRDPRVSTPQLERSRLSTAGDYEREAEYTRRRLAGHLEELSDRLTPGQVFDEMLNYSRAGGGTFLQAFTNAMRQNPVPSLLIGTGCMMFLSEKMGLGNAALGSGRRMMATADDDPYAYRAAPSPSPVSDATGRAAERASDAAGRAAERMADAAGQAAGSAAARVRSAADSIRSGVAGAAEAARRQTSDAAGAIADATGDTAASVRDTTVDAVRGTTAAMRDQAADAVEQARRGAKTAAGAMRDTAASMSGAVAASASSMGGALADTAGRTRRQAADVVRQSRDSAASFVTEQPLLCAAIGVAIGAALASLLPSTETEDRLMGEASDAVKETAGQVGSDVVQSAKNVASKAAERAQAAVKEEGLSPSATAEAARNLGEGIRQASEGAVRQVTTGTGPQEGASGSDRR